MSSPTVERQNLIEAVKTLPDEALIELSNFVEYLRYKNSQLQSTEPPKQNFLLAVSALGKSDQSNISDSDEEILSNEIDPIQGWSSRARENP
ncbi:MAG: DUF2281 domain-containing protein [Oscillatoriales cyanobacterium SM2_1_8]|nr:DUF2281 domain-containing protein [Oscillatoriales cyanobacterium SM2_1_8]